MLITRTPFRVSFLGGGSDLKEFYSKNGYGAVVSAAISYYMYIIIHPYFHDKIRIKYSITEDVDCADEIKHPIVRECLKKVRIERGIEIASFADIPSGTGLGSSSAFTVGLLNALYMYKGEIVSKEYLANEASEIEIDILGEPIGKQDQYAVAYGDINYIRFNKDESVNVSSLLLTDSSKKKLENNLCLFYVGGKRKTSDVLMEQKKNMLDEMKFHNLKKIVLLAEELKNTLQMQDIKYLGDLLHRGWLYKKKLATGISNNNIDEIYEQSMKNGAIGGKLLGAGGTGFLLFYSEDIEKLKSSLQYKSLPFKIDREGTKVIFYE